MTDFEKIIITSNQGSDLLTMHEHTGGMAEVIKLLLKGQEYKDRIRLDKISKSTVLLNATLTGEGEEIRI